eukprot:8264177-Pyramimonas_sp.AAC.1
MQLRKACTRNLEAVTMSASSTALNQLEEDYNGEDGENWQNGGALDAFEERCREEREAANDPNAGNKKVGNKNKTRVCGHACDVVTKFTRQEGMGSYSLVEDSVMSR